MPSAIRAEEKPNLILIVCDDLNGYAEGFGGHPQSHTPNMARLSKSILVRHGGSAHKMRPSGCENTSTPGHPLPRYRARRSADSLALEIGKSVVRG